MIKRDDYFYKRVISYALGVFIASFIYAIYAENALMQHAIGVYEITDANVGPYAVNRMFHDGLIIFVIGAIPALIHLNFYGRIRNLKQVLGLTAWCVGTAFVLSHIVFSLTLDTPEMVPIFRNALTTGWIFGGFVFGYARVLFFDNWRYD